MPKNLKIKIFGEAGAGKTTVAALLKQCLEQHGIDCEVTDAPDRNGPEFSADLRALRYLRGRKIRLSTHQLNRQPIQHL